MNLHGDLGPLGIIRLAVFATRLDASHLAQLIAFLEADPVAHVFGLGALERWGMAEASGIEWWGVLDSAKGIVSAVYAGDYREGTGFGLAVASGEPEATKDIGLALRARGGVRWAVGACQATDGLWAGLGADSPSISSDQVLMEATEVVAGQRLSIRPAVEAELNWVQAAASQMIVEDLGLDMAAEDPEGFSQRIASAIAMGTEFVAGQETWLVYRANVATRGAQGAQVGGVWVPPAVRGQGLGQAGTRALTALLLQTCPRVTLHVRSDNAVALACYRAVGFRHVRDFRLLAR